MSTEKSKSFSVGGKVLDSEGFFKTLEVWTKEDGSIKMNVADGLGKQNLLILIDTMQRCVEEENYVEN